MRFQLSSTLGTPAVLKAHVGPPGGHGSNVAAELYAKTLCIASVLDTENANLDRKSTRLNSSHVSESRMPSSA